MSRKIIIGVYKITNKITGKYYIGYSKNIYERWTNHRRFLKNNKHINIKLQRSYNKHTLQAFTFEILHKFNNEQDAKDKELEYLENLEIRKSLYNLHYNNHGGDTLSHHPDKENIIKRMLNTRKKIMSQMTIEERKEKYAYEKTDEAKKKISDAKKTHVQDKNTFYGKKHTEEQKQKWSEQKKGKSNDTFSQQVTIDNINYNSITEAHKKLNISTSTISKRIKSTESEFDNYKYTNEESNTLRITSKISINNIEYNSAEEASKKLNLTPHYIGEKLKSTDPKDNEWKILDKKRDKRKHIGIRVMINDVIYNSVKEGADFLNMNEKTLVKILNKEPVPISRKKPIKIDNNVYDSVPDASKILNINKSTIGNRLRDERWKNYIFLPIEYYDLTKFKYV